MTAASLPAAVGSRAGTSSMDGQAEPWWPLVLEIAIGIVIYEVLKWLLRCLLQKAGDMISSLPAPPLTPPADALSKNRFLLGGWWLRPPSSAESWACCLFAFGRLSRFHPQTPSIEPENCHSRVFRVTSQLLCAFAPMLQFGLTLTCLATKCHEVRSRVGLGRCNKVGPSPPANLRLCHPGQQVPMLRRDHWAFNAVRDKRVHPREQERPEET